MAKYSMIAKRTSHASQITVGSLNCPGASMRRLRLYYALFGHDVAGDNQFNFVLGRITTAGTAGSSVTPKPWDMADAACVAVGGQAHTGEPTYTANESMIDTPLNQRATKDWYAEPGGELVVPATANAGIGCKLGGTVTAGVALTATLKFEE